MDDNVGQIGRAEHSTEDHHQQVPCYEEKLARLERACDVKDTHGGGLGGSREAGLWRVKLGFGNGATGEFGLEEECRVLWTASVTPSPTYLYVEVLIPSVMVAEREIFPCHVDTERRQLPLSQEEGPRQEPSWSEP